MLTPLSTVPPPPQSVLWSGNVQASYSAGQVDQYLADTGLPLVNAQTGQRLDLGDGAFIEVLAQNLAERCGWRHCRHYRITGFTPLLTRFAPETSYWTVE